MHTVFVEIEIPEEQFDGDTLGAIEGAVTECLADLDPRADWNVWIGEKGSK